MYKKKVGVYILRCIIIICKYCTKIEFLYDIYLYNTTIEHRFYVGGYFSCVNILYVRQWYDFFFRNSYSQAWAGVIDNE